MSHTNVQKFIAALVGPLQDVETMFHQIVAMRNVNDAVGVHLTVLGKIVGRKRGGVADDEVYRRYVRAQVSTNKSNGLIDELLRIAELVVYDADAEYVLDNQGEAAYVLRVETVALPPDVLQVLITMLRKATAGAVRVIVEYWPTTQPRFRLKPFSGASSGLGFRSATDPTHGGRLAGARE